MEMESVKEKKQYKREFKCMSYNFGEPFESFAVFPRQHLDLRIRSGDRVLAQYYYVCVVPFGVLVDYIELIKEVLHVAVDAVVNGGQCFLCLLLGSQFTLLDASDAVKNGKRRLEYGINALINGNQTIIQQISTLT